MSTQLGKFTPHLADLTQPLRELLSHKNSWLWGPDQEKAFLQVKDELTKPSVLLLYDPLLQTKVTADASSFGLGAVLSQKDSTDFWRPVAFASRALSVTEKRYAQIEKEALAVTWASEKFQDFVLGKEFIIETDHKPLVPLLNSKNLDNLPPRVLRFRLRLARFNYMVNTSQENSCTQLIHCQELLFLLLLTSLENKKDDCRCSVSTSIRATPREICTGSERRQSVCKAAEVLQNRMASQTKS